MNDKTQRTPVVEPLLLMLKSRRVMTALATVIVGALSLAWPALDPVQTELLVLLLTLALAVIGGYSAEDAASAAREDASTAPDDLDERIKQAVAAVLDEMTDK